MREIFHQKPLNKRNLPTSRRNKMNHQQITLKLDLISLADLPLNRYYVKISTRTCQFKSRRSVNNCFNQSVTLLVNLDEQISIDVYLDPHFGFDKWIGSTVFTLVQCYHQRSQDLSLSLTKDDNVIGSLFLIVSIFLPTDQSGLAVYNMANRKFSLINPPC
jgi:hypothetical protein